MFWKFSLLASHIDTLLEKEDVTLYELMDEDDVLQECKATNAKLLEVLLRPKNLEELVTLVTTEPSSEDTDEKTRYKYPNIACELLTSDVAMMNDALTSSDDALLEKIYAFLEKEEPLNPLLASFFSKVLGLLIQRKSKKLIEFLKSRKNFIEKLLHHIGTSAIMDLLLRLISCVEAQEDRNEITKWLSEEKLVKRLAGLIDPSCPEEKHCNAAQSLCDIIRFSREQMFQTQEKTDPDPLLEAIESTETVAELLSHMLDGEKNESVLVNGLSVIQTLLEFKRQMTPEMAMDLMYRPEGSIDQISALDEDRLRVGIQNTLQALLPRLKDFHQILVNPPPQKYSCMPTTLGQLNPPLGNCRLQTCRLVATIIGTNTTDINAELVQLGTMSVLLDLNFKYVWNNFFHTEMTHCIKNVLNISPAEEEQHILLHQLFTDCKLINRILDNWEGNENLQSKPGGLRQGFMGHLTKIANEIVQTAEKGSNGERINNEIKDLPEEYKESWEAFVLGTLAETNKKNAADLVGNHPLQSTSEDDDTDFRDIPFPQTAMQQAFSDYQLQQMTSNFIDTFGFNEEELQEQEERVDAPFGDKISSIDFSITTNDESQNAAMFEQACNERMQQFDDHDSDEDIWEEKELTYSSNFGTKESDNLPSRTRHVGEGDVDDDSSSDEEDLDSPKIIRQTHSEKMDIDNKDWPNDEAMESAPVAMDTAPPAWATSDPSTPQQTNEAWAAFDKKDTSTSAAPSNNDNWADFSAFTPSDSSDIKNTKTETNTGFNLSERTSAYVVSTSDVVVKDLEEHPEDVDTSKDESSTSKDVPMTVPPLKVDLVQDDNPPSQVEMIAADCLSPSIDSTPSSASSTQSHSGNSAFESSSSDEHSPGFLSSTGLMKTNLPQDVQGNANGPTNELKQNEPKDLEEKTINSNSSSESSSPANGPI